MTRRLRTFAVVLSLVGVMVLASVLTIGPICGAPLAHSAAVIGPIPGCLIIHPLHLPPLPVR